MEWNTGLTVFYSSAIGCFMGYVLAHRVIKRKKDESINRLHDYWNKDIKKITGQIERLDAECKARNLSLLRELSPQFVNKPVGKCHCTTASKGKTTGNKTDQTVKKGTK